jgi:hypothetical protein
MTNQSGLAVVLGAAVQRAVKLNGEVVGKAVPQGFFYVDRPPGDYTVTTATEVEKKRPSGRQIGLRVHA